MSGQDIADLQRAVAELQVGLTTVRDTTHATLHLLAHLYTARCLAAPDPLTEYKQTAMILLDSLGLGGSDELPTCVSGVRDEVAQGLRHHIAQFLLLLQVHVEANLR